MENTEKATELFSKKYQTYLILLCFLVCVFVQLGRYSYSTNINLFIEKYGVTEKEAGIPSTLFFITYAVGQILNAVFCSKYNKRLIVGLCLFFSGVINVILCFNIPFSCISWLWLINGLLQSTLWPLIILILSQNIAKERLSSVAFLMSIAVSGGILLSYVISAILSLTGSFVAICLLSGVVIIATAFVWFLTTNKKIERYNETSTTEKTANKFDKRIITLIAVFAVFGMVSTAISYGLRNWMPKILKDTYSLSDWLSIFLSVFLPLSSTITAFISGVVYKRYKKFTLICGALFAITGVFLVVITLILNVSWLPVLILLILLSLSTGVVTNLMTVHVPLYFENRFSSGFLAGLLNGFCFVGTAISTYCLGAISTTTGSWTTVFVVFAVVCLITVFVALIFSKLEKIKEN